MISAIVYETGKDAYIIKLFHADELVNRIIDNKKYVKIEKNTNPKYKNVDYKITIKDD